MENPSWLLKVPPLAVFEPGFPIGGADIRLAAEGVMFWRGAEDERHTTA
jgi:hypothetical protein